MAYANLKTIWRVACEELHKEPEFRELFREACEDRVKIVDRSDESPKKVLPPFTSTKY